MTPTDLQTHLDATAAAPQRPGAASAPPLGLFEGAPPECLVALLDEFDSGAVICCARGQVLALNEAARRELSSGVPLCLLPDGSIGLRDDNRHDAGLLELRRAIRHAAVDRRHELLPLRGGRRTKMVSVRPLAHAPAGQALALIMLGRPEPCPELAVLALGRLFELTAAEQEILWMLLAGVLIKDMADTRRVALSTVRSQVAALRAKLGVRRIDDITRMAAEMPPLMGVLRTPISRCHSPVAFSSGACSDSAATQARRSAIPA